MTGTALPIATMQRAALSGVVRDSVDLEPVAYASGDGHGNRGRGGGRGGDVGQAWGLRGAGGGGRWGRGTGEGTPDWPGPARCLRAVLPEGIRGGGENEGIFPPPRPWPSFGIEGEGVYGYLDGVAPSRVTRVRVRQAARFVPRDLGDGRTS